MIDWIGGTWEVGDKARYHQGHRHKPQYQEVYAGLYWYAGFGSGTLFRGDGTMFLNCSYQEAATEATRLGLKIRFVDSFVVSSFGSVMG